MIDELCIKNFKCFKNIPCLKFKKFNILCGQNSSGKSSINQAILLLLQNNKKDKEDFQCNGKFVHFDDFSEIKNYEISATENVEISVKYGDKICKLELHYSEDDGNIECINNISEFEMAEEKNIYYLAANRIGPEDVYSKYNTNIINQNGENAIGFLSKYGNMTIDNKYAYIKDPQKQYNLKNEINYWLQEIIGEKINTNEISQTNKSLATYSKEGSNLQVRNKNTGSGLSYIISILVMVFSFAINNNTEEIPTFIIENPEIHLHPTAQIKLTKFLLFMSNFSQFIIETHSDYIIKNVLEENDTQLITLNNEFLPSTYTYNEKHILPKATLGEVQWSAFNIPTIDFHVHLYSYIFDKFGKGSINGTDDEIRSTSSFKTNKSLYETGFNRYYNGRIPKHPKKETLPTYMRNLIDHPEPQRNLYNSEQEFNTKLAESIQFMINIIKENGWN